MQSPGLGPGRQAQGPMARPQALGARPQIPGHIRVPRFRLFFQRFSANFGLYLQPCCKYLCEIPFRCIFGSPGTLLAVISALLGRSWAPVSLPVASTFAPGAVQKRPRCLQEGRQSLSRQALTHLPASCRSPGPPGRLGILSGIFLGASQDALRLEFS